MKYVVSVTFNISPGSNRYSSTSTPLPVAIMTKCDDIMDVTDTTIDQRNSTLTVRGTTDKTLQAITVAFYGDEEISKRISTLSYHVSPQREDNS